MPLLTAMLLSHSCLCLIAQQEAKSCNSRIGFELC